MVVVVVLALSVAVVGLKGFGGKHGPRISPLFRIKPLDGDCRRRRVHGVAIGCGTSGIRKKKKTAPKPQPYFRDLNRGAVMLYINIFLEVFLLIRTKIPRVWLVFHCNLCWCGVSFSLSDLCR